MPLSLILEYVTSDTEPVAPLTVLIRTPFCELRMLEFSIVTPLTVLSSRPPTEPMLSPWPPEQVPPVKIMFYASIVSICSDAGENVAELTVPELTARQSS